MPWRRVRLPTPAFLGFPGGSDCKESTYNAGDLGSISGLGPSPGEGNSYPLQYSGLENCMDCIVDGVAKSETRLSDFHWEVRASQVALVGKNPPVNAGEARDAGSIPGLGSSPGEGHGNPLQWFWPGESRGQKSLVGYSLCGHQVSGMTESLSTSV